jgi:hypothetical protein
LVSKFALKWVNLYRYNEGALAASPGHTAALLGLAEVGLYKLNPVDPIA